MPAEHFGPSGRFWGLPKAAMSGFDYSKWDRLEISDDETTYGAES